MIRVWYVFPTILLSFLKKAQCGGGGMCYHACIHFPHRSPMHIEHYEKGIRYTDKELLLLARKLGKMATYCGRLKDEASVIRIDAERRPTKKARDEVYVTITVELPKKTLRAESRKANGHRGHRSLRGKIEPQLLKYKDTWTTKGRCHPHSHRSHAKIPHARRRRITTMSFPRPLIGCTLLCALLLGQSVPAFAQEEAPVPGVTDGDRDDGIRGASRDHRTVGHRGGTHHRAGWITEQCGGRSHPIPVVSGWTSTRPISETVEAVYTPEEAGTLLFRLTITTQLPDGREVTSTAEHAVTVFSRKIVLVADASVGRTNWNCIDRWRRMEDIFLSILSAAPSPTPIGAQQALTTAPVRTQRHTAGSEHHRAVDRRHHRTASIDRCPAGRRIAAGRSAQSNYHSLSERSLGTLGRIAQGTFSALQPRQILLTRREALNPLFTTPTIDAFITALAQRDIEFLQIDAELGRICVRGTFSRRSST
jgi:ribosome-associated translation inhibitor RaiA